MVESLSGPMGSCEAQPYVGAGFVTSRDLGLVRVDESREQASLELLCYAPVDLSVAISGRLVKSGNKTVELFLNDTPLGPVRLSKDWQRFSFRISKDNVLVGPNILSLRSAGGTVWRDFGYVSELNKLPPVKVDRQALLLPFERPVEFGFNLPKGGVLKFDMRQWRDLGEAPLPPGQWELEVTVRGDAAETRITKSYEMAGSVELELPSVGPLSLLLKAHHRGTSLKEGQRGVKLLAPTVESPYEPDRGSQLPAEPPKDKPNVVLYLMDGVRPDHLSAYGYAHSTSPAFEALCQEGVLFEDVVSESSWTGPALATIHTGTTSDTHALKDYADQLSSKALTLAEALTEQGYRTAGFSNSSIAGEEARFSQGFQDFAELGLVSSERVSAAARSWLKGQGGEPFFLYVHDFGPHPPFEPSPDEAEKWLQIHGFTQEEAKRISAEPPKGLSGFMALARQLGNAVRSEEETEASTIARMLALYDAEIAGSDRALGEVLNALKQRGLYENTLIVVLSDHGEQFLEHGKIGHVHSLCEEVLRVPMVMKLPRGRAAGRRESGLWRHLDVMPSILHLVGLPVPTQIEGRAFEIDPGRRDMAIPAFFQADVGEDGRVLGIDSEGLSTKARGVVWRGLKFTRTQAAVAPTQSKSLVDRAAPGENLLFSRPATALYLETLVNKQASEKEVQR